MKASAVKLIECPRDAMQGWRELIPTERKKAYLEALLRVGFDTIDCGSFVSAHAIPQMADTPSLLGSIDKKGSDTRLLVIVANVRGARDAIQFPAVDYMGYPLSVSETFQQKNTNASIAESLQRLREMHSLCSGTGKQMVVYISMAFGNPYGDPYNESLVISFAEKIASEGIGIISLADTVGMATPDQVHRITSTVVQALPQVEVGVHLHSGPENKEAKISAAFDAGCRRFDGALLGIGGCPMANDALVGNINTEWLVAYFEKMGMLPPLREDAWREAMSLAREIFSLPLGEH